MLTCTVRFQPIIVFALSIALVSIARGEDAPDKAPIPEVNAQQQAMKVVKEVYGDEIAVAKTPAQKSAVATKLLQAGIEEKNDQAGRHALFTQASDLAADAGDLPLAWNAVDETQKVFQIDGPKMKADLAVGIARTLRTPQDRKAFVEQTDKLIQELLQQSRFDLAKQVGDLALVAARAANDPVIVRQATARIQQIRDTEGAYGEIKQAIATLEKTPSDPEANLKVGRFHCLVQGDWEVGLPMLALGSDQTLKALAEKEISGVKTPEEQVKLGDGWWQVGVTEKGTAKDAAQAKAASWYQQAAPTLSGLAKAKVEKRLTEVAHVNPAKVKVEPARGAVAIITDLETFQQVWKKGDNRGLLSFDAKSQTVTVDSPWDLGGFDVPEQWSEVSFNLAVEKRPPAQFDIDAGGVVLKLGDAVKTLKGDEVRIVFRKSDAVVDVYIGNRKVSSGSVLEPDFPKSMKIRFSSGGSTARILMRNIRYRPLEVPAAGAVKSNAAGADANVKSKTQIAYVRRLGIEIDEKGKCVISLDSRQGNDQAVFLTDLGADSRRVQLTTAPGMEAFQMSDGQFRLGYDFAQYKKLSDCAVVRDGDKSLRLETASNSLVLHPVARANGDPLSQFSIPRGVRLPMKLSTLISSFDGGAVALQCEVVGIEKTFIKFHVEVTPIGRSGDVNVKLLTWEQAINGAMQKERTLFQVKHPSMTEKTYEAMVPLRPSENLAYLFINNSKSDVGIRSVEIIGSPAGRVGVQLDDRTGAVVVTKVPDGPGKRAGIEAGDTIAAVNGQAVTDHLTCIRLIGTTAPGAEVVLTMVRDGKQREVKMNAE